MFRCVQCFDAADVISFPFDFFLNLASSWNAQQDNSKLQRTSKMSPTKVKVSHNYYFKTILVKGSHVTWCNLRRSNLRNHFRTIRTLFTDVDPKEVRQGLLPKNSGQRCPSTIWSLRRSNTQCSPRGIPFICKWNCAIPLQSFSFLILAVLCMNHQVPLLMGKKSLKPVVSMPSNSGTGVLANLNNQIRRPDAAATPRDSAPRRSPVSIACLHTYEWPM